MSWKSCVSQPLKWAISNEFNLGNISFPKQNMKKVSGSTALQCKWIPPSAVEFRERIEEQVKVFEEQTSEQSFSGSIVEPGMVEAVVVSAILSEKYEKIKCKIQLPLGTSEQYAAKYDINKNPYWGQSAYEMLKEVTNKPIRCVQIQLARGTGLLSSEKIGELSINWRECLEWPGQYMTRRAFLFREHPQQKIPHKLYIKLRWLPQSIFQQLTGFQMGSFKDKIKEIQASEANLQSGVLKVFLVRAKNLRAADGDTSDPYVIVEFQNHDKLLQQKSKCKRYTLNP